MSETQIVAKEYGTGFTETPAIAVTVYGIVFLYSLLSCWLVGSRWFTMIIYYFLGVGAFYIWHWQAHRKFWWNKACYEYHNKHHRILYPAREFYGTAEAKRLYPTDDKNRLLNAGSTLPFGLGKFRHMLPGYTSIQHEGLLYILGSLILFGSHTLGVPRPTIHAVFVGYLLMGFIANYIHQSLHHLGSTRNNYCVLNFKFDKIFKSYIVADPHDTPKERAAKLKEKMDSENVPQGLSEEMVKQFLLQPVKPALERGWFNVIARIVVVFIFVNMWYESQQWISAMKPEYDNEKDHSDAIVDRVHDLISPIHTYLSENHDYSRFLLIASTLLIDYMGLWLVFSSVIGKTFRPFFSLAMVFTLRQVCQLLISLPAPRNMIWRDPGVPSIFVTYETENDFFFSGHTAIAIIFAIELARTNRSKVTMLIASLLALFEIVTVLVLKAHWSLDVFAAIAFARWSSYVSNRYSSQIDAILP